jgi:hypothetical protein
MTDLYFDFENKFPKMNETKQVFFSQAFMTIWENIIYAVDHSPMPSGRWEIDYIDDKGIKFSGYTKIYARSCHVDTEYGKFFLPWKILFGGNSEIVGYCNEESRKIKELEENEKKQSELKRKLAEEEYERAQYEKLKQKYSKTDQ